MYTAVILAAGKGERTGLSTNKTNIILDHKPLFMHSVDVFVNSGFNVVLVINKNDEDFIKKWALNIKYVYGGATRGESVQNGLKKVSTKYVYIHDSARPFINEVMVNEIKQLLHKYDAVLTCKDVVNTIYNKDLNIVDRNTLLEAETPQAFLTKKIKDSYAKKDSKIYTDDISVFKEFYNDEIGLYYHGFNNVKITTERDLFMYIKPSFRIGHSYDIHKTSKDRKLILGGLLIESEFGLVGHSDADVLLHVVGESLLGALGLGDLGTHFPDTDMKYKDLDSKEIVKFSLDQVIKNGYVIENMDLMVFLEKPKLNPYINKIRLSISKLLNVNIQQINLKATTFEKLDSIGKKEAIAAEAVCLLRKKD